MLEINLIFIINFSENLIVCKFISRKFVWLMINYMNSLDFLKVNDSMQIMQWMSMIESRNLILSFFFFLSRDTFSLS